MERIAVFAVGASDLMNSSKCSSHAKDVRSMHVNAPSCHCRMYQLTRILRSLLTRSQNGEVRDIVIALRNGVSLWITQECG